MSINKKTNIAGQRIPKVLMSLLLLGVIGFDAYLLVDGIRDLTVGDHSGATVNMFAMLPVGVMTLLIAFLLVKFVKKTGGGSDEGDGRGGSHDT